MNPNDRLVYIVVGAAAPRRELTDYLRLQGYRVMAMASAAELSQRLKRLEPHLILLDVDLPAGDGAQVCKKLRDNDILTPLILLGARCEVVDRVIALEMGADDFIGKPYALREVYARVRALLRRSEGGGTTSASTAPFVWIGESTFSPATRRIGVHGQGVTLSEVDCSVLTELVAHPESVVSRERLMAASRANPTALSPTAVDRTVFRLRKLIEMDASSPRYIRSVRGLGYLYSPAGTASP